MPIVTDPLCRARMRFGNVMTALVITAAISCFAQSYRTAAKIEAVSVTVEATRDDVRATRDDVRSLTAAILSNDKGDTNGNAGRQDKVVTAVR